MTVPATVNNLESLVSFLEAHAAEVESGELDVSSLPSFGGAPVSRRGVYSWDSGRLLVGEDGWEIIEREVRCECGEVFGERCANSAPVSALVETEYLPAADVETARAAGTARGLLRQMRVAPDCAANLGRLGASDRFDGVVIGAAE